jgi:hypothetical protein
MKLTPWFPAHVKPAYPGVYEVKDPDLIWYRKWDGKRWCLGSRYPDCAANNGGMSMKELPWRGLAKPPKGWGKA